MSTNSVALPLEQSQMPYESSSFSNVSIESPGVDSLAYASQVVYQPERGLSFRDRGPEVTELQKNLNAFFRYTGQSNLVIGEDGVYGRQTQRAVEQFQRYTYLWLDNQSDYGTATPATLERLSGYAAVAREVEDEKAEARRFTNRPEADLADFKDLLESWVYLRGQRTFLTEYQLDSRTFRAQTFNEYLGKNWREELNRPGWNRVAQLILEDVEAAFHNDLDGLPDSKLREMLRSTIDYHRNYIELQRTTRPS